MGSTSVDGDLELLAEARLLRTADLLELADPGFQAELAEFLRVAGELEQPRLRYAALARRAMQALLAGFQIHVPKPVQPAELIAVVSSLAARKAPPSA